jgi:hypothetical protein
MNEALDDVRAAEARRLVQDCYVLPAVKDHTEDGDTGDTSLG